MNHAEASPNGRSPCRRPLQVRAGIFRRAGDRLQEVQVANHKDELVLAIEWDPRPDAAEDRVHELTVELWRGDELRDQRRQVIRAAAAEPGVRAYRLHFGDQPSSSSRLKCRVLLDGVEVGCWQVLVADVAVDAQGRFASKAAQSASAATMLAYAQEYEVLVQRSRR